MRSFKKERIRTPVASWRGRSQVTLDTTAAVSDSLGWVSSIASCGEEDFRSSDSLFVWLFLEPELLHHSTCN